MTSDLFTFILLTSYLLFLNSSLISYFLLSRLSSSLKPTIYLYYSFYLLLFIINPSFLIEFILIFVLKYFYSLFWLDLDPLLFFAYLFILITFEVLLTFNDLDSSLFELYSYTFIFSFISNVDPNIQLIFSLFSLISFS